VIKVMWLIKRADHLTLEEFATWWTETQAPDIRDEQVPNLVKYLVNIRTDDDLAAKPDEEPEWDGIAEEWFPTAAAFNAVYSKENREAHLDFVAHTSRCQRLIVDEIAFV
jgi:EthD domain